MSIDNIIAGLKLDNYIKTAIDITNYIDDKDERQKILKDLDGIVELNYKLKEKLKFVPKKSEDVINEYSHLDDAEINYDEISKKLSEQLESFEPNLSNHAEYKEFLSKRAQLSQDNEDSQDDDFAMTQEEIQTIDPFSKVRIQDPVKNTCGHVYDRESVTSVVKKNKKTRCPIPGCRSKEYISLANLKTDIITSAYLKRNPA